MESLSLYGEIKQGLNKINELNKLKKLKLYAYLENIDFLAENSTIQDLDISYNKLKDLDVIKTMTNLQKIHILLLHI